MSADLLRYLNTRAGRPEPQMPPAEPVVVREWRAVPHAVDYVVPSINVYLVIDPAAGDVWATIDRTRAYEATRTGCLVTVLPVFTDTEPIEGARHG